MTAQQLLVFVQVLSSPVIGQSGNVELLYEVIIPPDEFKLKTGANGFPN